MPNNNINITPYTIKTHSNVERFKRLYNPKIIGGTSIAMAAGVLTASAIGWIAAPLIIPAIIAGASFTVGGTVVAIKSVSGSVESSNNFKKMELKEVAELVEAKEKMAYKYTQIVNDMQYKGEITRVIDGKDRTVQQLKKDIRIYEVSAYKGVKYLMKQAKISTNNVEELTKDIERLGNNSDTLSVSEKADKEQKKKQEFDKLKIIGGCVRNITSKRNDVNPYKMLIIKALHKGCLIAPEAEDRINNQIRSNKLNDDIRTTQQLYYDIFEKELLQSNPPQQQAQPTSVVNTNSLLVKMIAMTKGGKRLLAQLANLNEQYQFLNEQNQDLDKQNQFLNNQNEFLNDQNDSLKTGLSEANKSLTEAKQKQEEANERVEQLKQMVVQRKEDDYNNELKAQKVDGLKSRVNRLLNEKQVTEEGIRKAAALAARKVSQEETRKTLEEEIQFRKLTNEALSTEAKQKQEEANERIYDLESENKQLKDENASLTGLANDYLNQIKNLGDYCAGLYSKIQELQASNLLNEKQINELKDRNARILETLGETNGMLQDARDSGKLSAEQIELLTNKITGLNTQIEKLEEAVEYAQSVAFEESNRANKAKEEVGKQKNLYDELQNSYNNVVEECEQLKQDEAERLAKEEAEKAASKRREITPLETANKNFISIYKKVNKHANQVDSSDILHQYADELIQKASEKYGEAEDAYKAENVETLTEITEELREIYKSYTKAKLLPPYDSGNVKPLGQ